jgi:prepilin-type N-terminal cleavage/methylation domain-containing protein
MDITLSSQSAARKALRQASRGLTLIEMMITMGIFGFAMAAFLAAYIFGLRQDQLVQSKLGASDESRRSFERVARDIRCANSSFVGNYSGGTFTPIINGNTNQGNALQVFLLAGNDGNPGLTNILYYFDTNGASGTWKLYRLRTGGTPQVIASHLQNTATFTAEDCRGVPLQSMTDRYIIHFILDFCEYQYPLTKVGTNYFYDRYVMDFRATPHVPGGK